MNPLFLTRALSGGLLTLALLQAPAAFAEEPHIRVSRLHIDYQVNADGSYVETTDLQEQLNSEQAVHAAGQIQLPHSSSLDELQVLEAYTLKRNGRRVPVPSTSVFVQDGVISPEGTTSYKDVKTTVVVFPDIDPGDSIALRTKLIRRRAMLPGVFTYARAFPGDVPHADTTITVTAPRSYPLKVQSLGLQDRAPIDLGDRRQWKWTYRSEAVERTEDQSVDPLMYRPRVLVSSVPSYAALSSAARQRFQDKAVVSKAIQDAAREIVGDARSPEEQVRRIYAWVAKNIRYFAVVLDVGGYVPRAADEVLASRFGDCKDHAVVLQALLAARGISSVPALLTTEPLYELPDVPVLEAFNHVILHVPSLNVFLDANSPSVAYGVLPFVDMDKPLLFLAEGPAVVGRSPAVRLDTDRTIISTRITVRPDGQATGEDRIQAAGPSALEYAAWADAIAQEDPVRVARQLLLHANFAGEGTTAVTRLADGKDFGFSLLYELRNFTDLRSASGLRFVPPMDTFLSSARATISETGMRHAPFMCSSRTEIQRIALSFPQGTRLTAPPGTNVSAAGRTYRSSYRVEGSTMNIERSYVSSLPHGYCPADDQSALRALHERILDDLRAEIRYVPPVAAASRSLEEVQRGFDQYKTGFYSLFRRYQRADPALAAGRIVVAFTITPAGSVVDGRIVSSSFGNPRLESDVLAQLSALRFEARDVAPFSYPNYPINFLPDT